MVNTDYQIEAIITLLNKDCILERYYPLIPYKTTLVEAFKAMGCNVKSDCLALPDDALLNAGLPTVEMVNQFKRFLLMYDVNPKKLREIDVVGKTTEEMDALRQLCHLPGVKSTRASLYYKAGFPSLDAIACSTPEETMKKTEAMIRERNMNLSVPFMKEIKTHIAVAKAFTGRF
ncbi:MAG: DUF4332 domain-containing protein [Ruminococcus sp.]